MKKTFTTLLTLLWAASLQASETLSLPFSVCGHTAFHVEEPVSIVFQGEEEEAYELKNVAKKGKVFYVPNGGMLLLKDADVESAGFVVQQRTAAQRLVIQLKGQNTMKAKKTAIQSAGHVLIVGEGVASRLDFNSRDVGLVMAGGDVTLRSLQLTGHSTGSTVMATGQLEKDATLELEQAIVDLTSQGQVVDGFSNVVATGCGLPLSIYATQKLTYDKGERLFHQETREGTVTARQLAVSCAEAYVAMDTREAVDSWSMDDGDMVEQPQGVVKLPFKLCNADLYTIGHVL